MKSYSVYRDGVLVASVKARKAMRALMDVMGMYDWCAVNGVRGEWTVQDK